MSNVYLAPAGTPLLTSAEDLADWEPLGYIGEGGIAPEASRPIDLELSGSWSATFRLKGSRLTASLLFGFPYKHPRQILHNGRKP